VRVAAIVPVNALNLAKSRLAAVLGAADRERLVMWLLERVRAAVVQAGTVNDLAVVSPDRSVLGWARARALTAVEQQTGDLNTAVELGRGWASATHADALLVLLGDLPLLASEDVRALCDLAADLRNGGDSGAGRSALVLAPDRTGQGTNALLLSPPQPFPFSFGRGSYARHVAHAHMRAMALGLYISPRTTFDVDLPSDLAELSAQRLWSASPHHDETTSRNDRSTDGRAG
jgi:2-phospho-L-lactate guanylyltransferase